MQINKHLIFADKRKSINLFPHAEIFEWFDGYEFDFIKKEWKLVKNWETAHDEPFLTMISKLYTVGTQNNCLADTSNVSTYRIVLLTNKRDIAGQSTSWEVLCKI